MSEYKIFIDRRRGDDRRYDLDPCKNMPIDLYHRKRRKAKERRNLDRGLAEDYLAYLGEIQTKPTH